MRSCCAGCKRRITRGEPDLILQRMDPDNPMRTAREENRLAWQSYFCSLAGTLRARAEEYDRRAALLEDEAS